MRMNRIYVYNTHYRIYDYTMGDFPELERDLTYYNHIAHKEVPKYFYDRHQKIMYVPRGYDDAKLIQWNQKVLSDSEESNPRLPAYFSMKYKPKNEDQVSATDYLVGDGVYKSKWY